MHEINYILSPMGDSIAINLPGKNGEACEVVLTFDEASSLAMTLPRLLTTAFRRKYSDETLRHVYPLRGYALEGASDLRHLIVTLSVGEGFDVAFAVKAEIATAIARDLVSNGKLLAAAQRILPQ